VDRAQILRDLAIVVPTMLLCSLPFMGQAFHMDDNFYMDTARNAQTKPWFPNDLPYVYQGVARPDMGSHSHPTLQTYFLALLQRLAGEGPGKEWIYHSCALVYPILAVLGMYFIAARLVERPVWPALVLAIAPVFMIMQHTLMADVPMLAFWLASIATFLWATDSNRRGLYAASALVLFAAMLTSYQSAALVPLLGFYQMRKGKGHRGWVALSLAVVAFAGWFALNCFHYDRFLLWNTAVWVRSRGPLSALALGTKLVSLLQYQGWLVLFPLFPLLMFGRGLRGRLFALVTLVAVYLTQAVAPNYRPLHKAIFVVGLVTGTFVLKSMALLMTDSFRSESSDRIFDREEEQFLALWYFGVAAYCIVIFTEGSARYVLTLVPPLLITFFRKLELQEIVEYRLPRTPLLNSAMIASGALVLTLAWGLALSHADREFAGIYPRAVADISRVASDLQAYYVGEWGFRYYSRRARMQQLPIDDREVSGGSLVVRPTLALPHEIPAGLNSMLMSFQTFSFGVRTPLRVLDRDSHAGFYSTGWGLLPFSFSRKSLERVEVGQVNYLVERLPWAEITTATGVKPWPGYVTIEARGPLAILAKPGTRILYDWSARAPLDLAMNLGLSHDSYSAGDERVFLFEVLQYGDAGAVLARESRSLAPGKREGDRKWQPVLIRLPSRQEGLRALELRYESQPELSAGAGAFADAYLRSPQ